MKFAMEEGTLVRLGLRSQTESEDLVGLVRQLAEATEPLEGLMNGPARAAVDHFQGSLDEISGLLSSALAGIVQSISGQNQAFVMAAEEGAATHQAAEGSADFSSGAFLTRVGPQ